MASIATMATLCFLIIIDPAVVQAKDKTDNPAVSLVIMENQHHTLFPPACMPSFSYICTIYTRLMKICSARFTHLHDFLYVYNQWKSAWHASPKFSMLSTTIPHMLSEVRVPLLYSSGTRRNRCCMRSHEYHYYCKLFRGGQKAFTEAGITAASVKRSR